MAAGTEKGPGEGALCLRKDVPPAIIIAGPSVLQVSWLGFSAVIPRT